MKLSVSKRFEISFSHRCFDSNLSDDENYNLYGDESRGNFGHGHNMVAVFGFTGQVDPKTGMVINVTTIKEKINRLLASRYDHKYLNLDTPPFDKILPTMKNIGKQLFSDAEILFENESAQLDFCHLSENPDFEVLVSSDDSVFQSINLDFSAARRTFSPHLSDSENEKMFGVASLKNGHGHHYRLKLTYKEQNDDRELLPHQKKESIKENILTEFDHKNISTDIDKFKHIPNTTEAIALYIKELLKDDLEVENIRLEENDYFFVEIDCLGKVSLGLVDSFHCAHRLHSDYLTNAENVKLYEKCNNFEGHGHKYIVEVLLSGEYDEKTGILYNLLEALDKLKKILEEYNYKHIDKELDEFKDDITTSENIVRKLFDKIDSAFTGNLNRIRLWETPNNCFEIRK